MGASKSSRWFKYDVRRGIEYIILLTSFSLFMAPLCVDSALFCYSCLAMECPGDQIECEGVREFAVSHLRSFYDLDTYIRPCLPSNDTLGWRLQQVSEPPCLDTSESATCTAGHMQIKTKRGNEKPPFITHATIMGCANRKLMASIRRSVTENRCDLIKQTGMTNEQYELTHELELEHCSRIEAVCHHTDFCISHQQSVIKEFKNVNRSLARFDFGLVLGIVAFIIVVFAAIVGASLCSFPLNRPSNLPKSSTGDTSLVAVRSSKSEESIDKLVPLGESQPSH